MTIEPINIDRIREKMENLHIEIMKKEFVPFFESMRNNYTEGFVKKSPSLRVERIRELSDLDKIPNSRGLYLIFTDYASTSGIINECNATLMGNPNAKVIYRGESYNVRTRLESHLFHDTYHERLREEPTRTDRYTVCLKMDDQQINLDAQSSISDANWYVAYHGFPKSTRVMREIAERAFDHVFNKPICSREK